MARMPYANAAHAPAPQHFAGKTFAEMRFAWPEWELVNGVRRDVVSDIENAGSFVALPAIHVFGTVRLTATNGAVVNRMGPVIASLKGKAAGETALQSQEESVIRTRAHVGFVVDRAKR